MMPKSQKEWVKRNPEKRKLYQRKTHLRAKYGLTLEDYQNLLIRQNGGCAICCRSQESTLHVDHDHQTGRVRGLLCNDCNLALGKFGDSIAGVQRALDYLKASS